MHNPICRLAKCKVNLLLIFFLISMVSLCLSCSGNPKPLVITYQLALRADTLFYNQYAKKIDEEIDSLCIINRNLYYQQAVDSLLTVEYKRMQVLLE